MKLNTYLLTELGERLGYNLGKNGICAGYSGAWVQAVLADEEENFYKRLRFIKKYTLPRTGSIIYDNFDQLQMEIEQARLKVSRHQTITDEELELLEIPAFYETLMLYLLPMQHTSLFNGTFTFQHNISSIYDLAKSEKLDKTDIHILSSNRVAFNKNELTEHVMKLMEILQQTSDTLPIRIESGKHSVCLKYDSESKNWFYLDTLKSIQVSRQDSKSDSGIKQTSFYQKLTTEQLVDAIFNSFETEEFALVNILVFAKNAQLEIRKKLIGLNSEIHLTEDTIGRYANGIRLLWLACSMGDDQAVRDFLAFAQSIKKTDFIDVVEDSGTSLYIACQNNYLAIVEQLLEAKANPNLACDNGQFPLQVACYQGNMEMIIALLSHDTDINQRDKLGRTALYMACIMQQPEIVTYLLQNKADCHMTDVEGNTPLIVAVRNKNWETVKRLMQHDPAVIFQKNNADTSILHYASAHNNKTLVIELLSKHKLDSNEENDRGNTPLSLALKNDHLEIAQVLLSYGASLNESGYTELLTEINTKKWLFEKQQESFRALETLHSTLKMAAETYFNGNKTIEDRDHFIQAGKKAIHKARYVLESHNGWDEFFVKLLLGIVSVGIIPLTCSIKNRLTTGVWQFTIFKHKPDTTCDKAAHYIDAIKPGSQLPI